MKRSIINISLFFGFLFINRCAPKLYFDLPSQSVENIECPSKIILSLNEDYFRNTKLKLTVRNSINEYFSKIFVNQSEDDYQIIVNVETFIYVDMFWGSSKCDLVVKIYDSKGHNICQINSSGKTGMSLNIFSSIKKTLSIALNNIYFQILNNKSVITSKCMNEFY